MLYILDDDQFNAISTSYSCGFVMQSPDTIRYYKNEEQIDFKIEDLTEKDIVCYHNSFPCDKTLITSRLVSKNEKESKFKLICFSAATEFYNLEVDKGLIKIHKDRFYNNLKEFIASDFDLKYLFYGAYSKEAELSLLLEKFNSSLFQYSKDSPLPIGELHPRDLKRFCELAEYDYTTFIEKISDFNIDKFKRFISILTQNN